MHSVSRIGTSPIVILTIFGLLFILVATVGIELSAF
jgi:hypothetical protein